MRYLLLAGTLFLTACVSTPTAEQCLKAQQTVTWAKVGLELACTKQSKACDTAGIILRHANQAVSLLCEADEP